ncbi:alpha-N-acetylgalactosaminidase-like [Macrobrachium rosenbergii]|uniref:alpha-N-acetylgalactosaminidase-like n=1 Tax=Macrobrachium rosenbergii TaxID=79674 RepID=UPI0034D5DD49
MRGITALGVLFLVAMVGALENGLARTPPMGWLAWQRYRCNTDCVNDPDNCISEQLFMKTADLMVSEGYLALGYDVVSMDDCWPARERDADGKLQPDAERFPSGLKKLGDYIHSKGLKFGIYEDYGTHTCAGYPGILEHMELDAQTFAEWGVDYVKLDGCYSDPHTMDQGYPEFGSYLNKTGRPIVYSCSWPDYLRASGIKINWTAIIEHCNLWRNYNDISDSWGSVTSIVNYYGDNQDEIAPNAGPGHWNDPDMLLIGNFGLSYEQSRAQMALWAVLASPLLMSVDLQSITPPYKEILQNKDIIAVNQDPLGIQGRRVSKKGNIEIWTRPVTPTSGDEYSYAVVVFNQGNGGGPSNVTLSLKSLGMTHSAGYLVSDLYEHEDIGKFTPDQHFYVKVNPSGVKMLRFNLS